MNMNKCSKCKKDTESGSTFVEGGISYRFCKDCSDILNTFSIPTNIIPIFLQSHKEMGNINKNIFDAREKRLKGNSPWKKNVEDAI